MLLTFLLFGVCVCVERGGELVFGSLRDDVHFFLFSNAFFFFIFFLADEEGCLEGGRGSCENEHRRGRWCGRQ
ncbi:hypothetical protein TCDM_01221 [Trypanosoma cruzi Dm28c]|uniref:Secreted protein n=1 Tax=Trypanosoma cruzi Dm28c TaxID=1416333 RepID=V5BA23_TRYCR|nr:hypothetical protein TCDM_01221 [Trypanosoma cruzi Dm28c]